MVACGPAGKLERAFDRKQSWLIRLVCVCVCVLLTLKTKRQGEIEFAVVVNLKRNLRGFGNKVCFTGCSLAKSSPKYRTYNAFVTSIAVCKWTTQRWTRSVRVLADGNVSKK